jgi:hypothetical protein
MYNRDELLRELRSNVIEVHFTKVNGEGRVMRCTLMDRFLPESFRANPDEQTEEKNFHQKNPDVIACWDTQVGGWRSFRVDSVTYCQGVETF